MRELLLWEKRFWAGEIGKYIEAKFYIGRAFTSAPAGFPALKSS
jgi:hypothetical protein